MSIEILSLNALSNIWRRKFTVALVLVLSLGAALAYNRSATRVYEASVWLLMDSTRAAQASPQSNPADNSRRELQLNSQANVAQSEDVIRGAIASIGAEALYPQVGEGQSRDVSASETKSTIAYVLDAVSNRLRTILLASDEATSKLTEKDKAYLRARRDLYVSVQPNTDIFTISFRHSDPAVAAAFVNKVAETLIDRNSKLSSNPLAVSFFETQAKHYRSVFDTAAKRLQEFADRTRIFAVDEQKTLLLGRRAKASEDLAFTEGAILRMESELASMRLQLSTLRSRITLPSAIFGPSTSSQNSQPNDAVATAEPPLLHLRIYQDSAQQLVKNNADLAGLRALREHQNRELAEVDKQLRMLSTQEAEFARLKQDVVQASAQAELFAKRGVEAEAENAWRSNERLSSLQIVQTASPPLGPVLPKTPMILVLGTIIGLLFGTGLAIFLETISNHRQSSSHDSTRHRDAAAITHLSPSPDTVRRQTP